MYTNTEQINLNFYQNIDMLLWDFQGKENLKNFLSLENPIVVAWILAVALMIFAAKCVKISNISKTYLISQAVMRRNFFS